MLSNTVVVSTFLLGSVEFVANMGRAEAMVHEKGEAGEIERDEPYGIYRSKKMREYFGENDSGQGLEYWKLNIGNGRVGAEFIYAISRIILSENEDDYKIIEEMEWLNALKEFKNVRGVEIERTSEENVRKENEDRIIFMKNVREMGEYIENIETKLQKNREVRELTKKLRKMGFLRPGKNENTGSKEEQKKAVEKSTKTDVMSSEANLDDMDAEELNKKKDQYFEAIAELLRILIDEIRGTYYHKR